MRFLLAIPVAVAAAPVLAQDAGGDPGAGISVAPAADQTAAASHGITVTGASEGSSASPPAAHGKDIVVVAPKLPGQVDAPEPPIITFTEEDIAAYGADSIEDLIALIAPETDTGRGRGAGGPVFLLNGQRIASFREMRDIPPEAIKMVEVLPEEVALRYGYAPDQRVVNFILKDHFRSKTLVAEDAWSTHGGTSSPEAKASMLQINGPRRLNLTAGYTATTLLTEADRNIQQEPGTLPTVSTDPDPAQYRSLVPSDQTYTLNGIWSTGLGHKGLGGSLSLNTTYTHENTRSLSGLDTVTLTDPAGDSAVRTLPGPLTRFVTADTVQFGTTLNKQFGKWHFTGTVDSSYGETDTRIDRRRDLSSLESAAAAGTLAVTGPLPNVAGAGADYANERDISMTSLATLVGNPFSLPAGKASLTLKTGYSYANTHSSDTRTALPPQTFDRGDFTAGINLALPLTKHGKPLGVLGDITANFSVGYDYLSDVGSLTNDTAGVTWNLTSRLGLQASYIVNEAAPTLAQIGAPSVQTLNVPIYDFATGKTVLVTTVTGGNPGLVPEHRHDIKLGLNWRMPILDRSNLIVEYFNNRSRDFTAAFPLLTPEIEAAFPGRIIRDAQGNLVEVDERSVTFAAEHATRLRWGFNLGGKIAPSKAAQERAEASSGGGLFGPPGGGNRAPRGGRWNFSVYHTVNFSDRVTVAPGGPVLDLLGGDALVTGGEARHSIEAEGGAFYPGIGGLRLNGTWSSPVHVNASGAPDSSALRFGSVFKLDARFFFDFGQEASLVRKMPFLKGFRASLKVGNILDSRQRVTNSAGAVPIAYQPDYIDPQGRTIGFDFRKMF